LKFQGKRPKVEGMGEGGGYGLCLNTYIFVILISEEFEVLLLRTKSKDSCCSLFYLPIFNQID